MEGFALRLVDSSVLGFAANKMCMFEAAARRRRRPLIGGEEGKADIDAADAVMRSESIQVPERFTNVFAPGFG